MKKKVYVVVMIEGDEEGGLAVEPLGVYSEEETAIKYAKELDALVPEDDEFRPVYDVFDFYLDGEPFMLKFMKKAGDEFEILTVDSKTPAKDLPDKIFDYRISHTQGFTFPLYNHISLTFDLPEMKGARILEKFKPDLIHTTSP